MKVIRRLPILWATLVVTAAQCMSAGSTSGQGNWSIEMFDVSIDVGGNGLLDITETIVAQFQDAKHGIYREIPIRYQVGAHQYSLRFRLVSVDDGSQRKRTTKTKYRDNLVRIRIGDPDVTVTGRQVYRIRYQVNRAILWEGDHSVLRWNPTGTQWRVPIRAAVVNVKLPEPVDPAQLSGLAWTGVPGTRDRALDYSTADNQTLQFRSPELRPGEGMTIDIAFPATLLVRPGLLRRLGWWLTDNFFYGILLASLGSCLGFWYFRGRDRPGRQTIMVQYEPPDALRPAEVGTLIDERVDLRDISATIIDLAVRGHLRIEEIQPPTADSKADYRFLRLKPSDPLLPFERRLMDQLFVDGDQVHLSDLREKFYPILPALRNELYQSLTQAHFFDGHPSQVRKRFAIVSIVVLLILLGAGIVFQIATTGRLFLVPLIVSGVLAIAGILVTSWFMPRKTRKGSIAWEKIAGLEEYIRRAEVEHIQTRDPQGEFEKLLPYAIVFGLADRWATAFTDLYRHPPEWYRPAETKGFSTALLAQSMNRSVESMNQVLPSQPRSTGSGTSWSGGGFSGGSVGGGFGGGGGGGW